MALHVVFSAECNNAMTWQSIALFHSFRQVHQFGNITRLLACSQEQLAGYNGLDVGPTFVHHNMRFGHPLIHETGYPSYNKPASVMFFLQQVDVREQFIALLDTDMVLRAPLDPISLGAKRGVVVSAEYSYLVGTDTSNATHDKSFARRFLRERELPLMVRCGGFHIFHKEDIRNIAPLWIEFTSQVRKFAAAEPETYFAESFLNWHDKEGLTDELLAVRKRQGLWQAEMYGYIFGAARVGVSHIVRRDTMLYPGYAPVGGLLPAILHYGADYTLESGEESKAAGAAMATATAEVNGVRTTITTGSATPLSYRSIYFNKMQHQNLDVFAYLPKPPASANPNTNPDTTNNNAAAAAERSTTASCSRPWFNFGQPPPPMKRDGSARSRRDILCIQHLQLLNGALCDFFTRRCEEGGEAAPTTASSHTAAARPSLESSSARPALECPREYSNIDAALMACVDEHAMCGPYTQRGECANNPDWMLTNCAKSCNVCGSSSRKRVYEIVRPFDRVGPKAQDHEDPMPPEVRDPLHSAGPGPGAMMRVGEAASALGCSEGLMGKGRAWCNLSAARIAFGVLPGDSDALGPSRSKPADLPLQLLEAVSSRASFGARLHCLGVYGRLIYAGELCSAAPQPAGTDGSLEGVGDITGHVLLVVRGGCPFVTKARVAQALGASAILVYDRNAKGQHADDQPLVMSDDGTGADVTIAAIGLGAAGGRALTTMWQTAQNVPDLAALNAGTASVRAGDGSSRRGGGGALVVSIEGVEIVMATRPSTDDVVSWELRSPSEVRLCGDRPDAFIPHTQEEMEAALRAHKDGSSRGRSGGSSGSEAVMEQHAVDAIGAEVEVPVDAGVTVMAMERGCVPQDRCFTLNARAFGAAEWAALRANARCPVEDSD